MKVVLVGGGPSNIYLALRLLDKGHEVHLYEKTNSIGKKFLVAGKSGLNITHSEKIEKLSERYFENKDLFQKLFNDFNNTDLIIWLESFEVKTFVGSSGRVFPEEFKASQIIKKWNDELNVSGNYHFYPNHTLTEVSAKEVEFNNEVKVSFDKIVYGLGGASWKITGSDGSWSKVFDKIGIKINKFYPANCGFDVEWSDSFKEMFTYTPLKNITCAVGDHIVRGDIMLTSYGVEGTPIYSLSKYIREQIINNGQAHIKIDFKPDLSLEDIKNKLKDGRKKDSVSNLLRKKLGLNKNIIKLLKEFSDKESFKKSPESLIKNYTIRVKKWRPLDEAISTSGGIILDEVDSNLMLKKFSNHYVVGEMLDWETITGGYLLQGCFSQAHRIYSSLIV